MIGLLCSLARAAEPTLDALKQTYETEVREIQNAHDLKLNKLLDTYARSLAKAIAVLKQEGDPDLVLQALSEKRRFEQEKTVPAEPDGTLPRIVRSVQASYLKAVEKATAEKSRTIANFTPNYIAALERLMKTLTAREELDLALNVKEEKKRVEFILAEAEVKVKGHDEPDAGGATPPDTGIRLPEDAVAWNGHHYMYYPGRVTWGEAQRRCVKVGGHLAIVESPLELQLIKSIADRCGEKKEPNVWVGAKAKGSKWVWLDGKSHSAPYGGRKKAGDYLAYHRNNALFGIRESGRGAGKQWIVHGYICEWDY